MASVWTIFLPPDAMPSNRPNLTLDEQSFQGLLSAAFTIQEHNDQRKLARQAQAEPEVHPEPEANRVCRHCGAPMPAGVSRCERCGLDEFRPGERMQHNWASMWLMSQEQGLWPERSLEIREGARKDVPPLDPERRPRAQAARNFAGSGFPALPVAREVTKETIAQENTDTIHGRARGKAVLGKSTAESNWTTEVNENEAKENFAPEDSDLTVQPFQLSTSDDSFPTDARTEASTDTTTDASAAGTSSMIQRFADWRVKLRFQRADLYLGTAIFVAALALLWPTAGAPGRAALGPWERALVTLGIAEAPAPMVHLQGDPGIQVWVDPHTALYYCPGEEQYGKTANGRFSPQREAQMDRFEPAGRSACE
jgi:ribosomal protein L40E